MQAVCPFCQSELTPGATVCAQCGATEVRNRPAGPVLLLGCAFPVAASFVLLFAYSVLSGGKRGGDITALETIAILLIVSAWILGLVLATRVPKKSVWVRRVG